MPEQQDLSSTPYVRYIPDSGTDASAFEPKADPAHAGYFEFGVTVNGTDVPLQRWKGGQYDIDLTQKQKTSKADKSQDDSEPESS